MTRGKSRYVLDAREETERLERQSRTKAFDFEDELRFLEIREGQRVLDAGCGSGLVSDYLARRAPGAEVVGCDFSKERVEDAKARYGSSRNVTFVQQNLLEMRQEGERFDVIVCRYVLRHFSPPDGKRVIRNLYDALKPGGVLYCIDVEGLMGDVYPASAFLRSSLRKVRESKVVDFQVARKLPALLSEQGLEGIDWHVLVSEFKGQELAREIVNLEESVKNAEPFALRLLGGPEKLERFKKEYFSALREREGLALFYNRIIALGTKPNRKLEIVATSGN